MTYAEVRNRTIDAHQHGKARGYEAVEHCEVGPDESLAEAAFRAERNARPYAGHVPQWIRDSRDFFRAYEDGVASAIRDAT